MHYRGSASLSRNPNKQASNFYLFCPFRPFSLYPVPATQDSPLICFHLHKESLFLPASRPSRLSRVVTDFDQSPPCGVVQRLPAMDPQPRPLHLPARPARDDTPGPSRNFRLRALVVNDGGRALWADDGGAEAVGLADGVCAGDGGAADVAAAAGVARRLGGGRGEGGGGGAEEGDAGGEDGGEEHIEEIESVCLSLG